jgi:hypothetical protein
MNFAPPLFLVYLLALGLEAWGGPILLVPFAAYLILVLAQAVALAVHRSNSRAGKPEHSGELRTDSPSRRVIRSIAAIPLIFMTPILYGAGFWLGLFTSLRKPENRPPTQVTLENVA